jgi:hypothetical protein
MARILVVAADIGVGARAQAVAESDGHEVVWCGGPARPTFVCAGGRGDHCPLTERVDAVIVDGWLDSDAGRCGVPSTHLILYYRRLGIPVLALVGPNGLPGPLVDDGIQALGRHATASEIRFALRDLLDGVHIRRRIPVVTAAGIAS